MKPTLIGCIALCGMLVIAALPVSAQLWNNNQQLMFQDGNFNHFAAANPQIAQELMHNPNLVNDPRYLAAHPQLVSFMNKYPHAAASLRANPAGFLHQDFRSVNGGNVRSYDGYDHHHHHEHDDHWHY